MILQLPAATPVTNPEELTVAMAVLLLLHAPVPPLSTAEFAEYVAVPPIQRGLVPVTVTMLAFEDIVIACCAEIVPPQPPVIV